MFIINFKDARPMYEQIYSNIISMTLKGIIKHDEQLPSIRQLAMELSINPNTVQRAYSILEQKGIIYSVKGIGSFISVDSLELRDEEISSIKDRIQTLVQNANELGVDTNTIIKWIIREE